jgi:predicted nucleotidyltransferase
VTPESRRRRGVARRIADAAAASGKVEAVALVGSTARGNADAYSDVDLSVYYRERPTRAELEEFRERLAMTDWRILGGSEDEDFVDAWSVDGVEGQAGHGLLSGIELLIDDVVIRYDTDHDKHTIMGGLAEAIPLHGSEIVERLKSRVTYPEGLARAMVAKHLSFRPIWSLENRFAGRDALFPFMQVAIEWERRILGVLLGLNRLYPEHDFKRLGNLTARLSIAPRDFDQRLRRVLRANYGEAVRELGDLVEDTIALVERQMPEVDTSGVRAEMGRPDPGH